MSALPPIPAYPATLGLLADEQRRAREKYRPLVLKLRPGELLGLVDVAVEELERRGNAIRAERGAAPVRIGNR
jgi:hypothetical protein